MSATDDTTYARRYWILGVLCVPLVLVGMAITILNVAIPSLVRALHADPDELQWIFAVYGIVFAGLVITMGAIGDRFGRRRLLNLGLVVFGLASGVGAWAGTAGALVVARAAMGLGAAMLMPGTLSIVTTVFPPEERQQAIGIWSGVGGLGFILGPPVAGILLSNFWWGSVMLVNVPLVVLALVASARLVPESRDPERLRLDLIGAALSVVAVAAMVFAFIDAPDRGWLGTPVLTAIVVSLAAGASFVFWELHHRHPMLDVRLFRVAAFRLPALVITLGCFTVWGLLFLLPQYLEFVHHSSVLAVGITLAFISVTWSLSAPLAPKLVLPLTGDRAGIALALLVTAGGALCFVAVGGGATVPIVIVGLAVIGLGMGTATTPATTLLVSAVPAEQAGVGSAMNDVTREFGTAFGIAVLGTVLTFRYAARLGAVAGLSSRQAAAARDGIGNALHVASTVSGPVAAQVRAGAEAAFTSGFRLAVLVGAGVLVGLAALVWLQLPRGAGAPAAPPPDDAAPKARPHVLVRHR